jgi:hypothetical protein
MPRAAPPARPEGPGPITTIAAARAAHIGRIVYPLSGIFLDRAPPGGYLAGRPPRGAIRRNQTRSDDEPASRGEAGAAERREPGRRRRRPAGGEALAVRGRQLPVRSRRAAARSAGVPADRAEDALPRGDGRAAAAHAPMAACAPSTATACSTTTRAAHEGRAALSSAGRPRRGPRARLADDLEDRGRRPALRRRQGRHRLRPARARPDGSSGSRGPSSSASTASSARTRTSPRPT